MSSILGFLHPKTPTIAPEVQKEFIETIELAQTQDHQVYYEKKLKIFDFSLNAALPSLKDLIVAPYRIVKTGFEYSEGRLISANKSLKKANMRMLADFLSLVQSCLKPLLYLTYIGITVVHVKVVIPIIFTAATICCLIGLAVNLYDLAKQYEFISDFDPKELEVLTESAKNLRELNLGLASANLKKLIDLAKSSDFLTSEEFEMINKGLPSVTQIGANISEFATYLSDLESKVYVRVFKNFENKFLDLSSLEKKQILHKSLSDLGRHPKAKDYPHVLKRSLEMTQNRFRKKKVNLVDKIHYQGALEAIEKARVISSELAANNESPTDETKQKLIDLLQGIKKKAQTKKDIQITNIALYTIGLVSLTLTTVFSGGIFTSIIFFVLSLTLYYLNEARIKSYLENNLSNLKLKLLIPKWMIYIHGCFSSKASKDPLQNTSVASQPALS